MRAILKTTIVNHKDELLVEKHSDIRVRRVDDPEMGIYAEFVGTFIDASGDRVCFALTKDDFFSIN